MIGEHESNIAFVQKETAGRYIMELTPLQQKFLDALVQGRQRTVFSITDDYFSFNKTLEEFYPRSRSACHV